MHIVNAACLTAVAALAAAAPEAERRRLTPADVADVRELIVAADKAMTGEAVKGDAALSWQEHFLRAPDRKIYVPFTIVIGDAPADAFSSVAVYIRVAKRGDRETRAQRDRRIGPTGAGSVPVFAYDQAAAASAALRLLDRPDQRRPGPYPFEALHFGLTEFSTDGSPIIRRAVAVPPGRYDVYVMVREREATTPPRQRPKLAMLKREMDVPDLTTAALATSSLILARRVEPLVEPLQADEQAERPYALGTSEIVPATSTTFAASDSLSVVFLIYNAQPNRGGKPDVEVTYRCYGVADAGERLVFEAPAQRFDAGVLPPAFDLRAGHQLVPMQTIPIASFAPGDYRLEVQVTDKIAGLTTSGDLRFTVR